MMRITAAALLVPALAASGFAASVRSLEGMQKQAGKVAGPLSVDSAKSLCACHLPNGEVHAGIVTQFVVEPSPGTERVAFGCALVNYSAGTGNATSTVGCGFLNGTWEFVAK